MPKAIKRKVDMDQVRVGRSSAGLGLFARVPFTRGDLIIEYFGPMLSGEEADRQGGKYLFAIDDEHVINGTTRKNVARYVNHACKPNCYTEINEDEQRVYIYAQKKIQPGEELTYDYGKEYFDDIIKPHGCKCASCLGTKS